MKKVLIITFILIIVFMSNTKASANMIPDEAIRLRVIANSNSEYDQNIKIIVRDKVQNKLYNLLKDTKGIDNARRVIDNNLNDIDNIVKTTLEEQNYNQDYSIDFGDNYFPKKVYKGITYEEGNYESLVIKLGNGEGNNWWCVLFPPLCLLEAEENEEASEVEYKFFIQELIEKYL